MTQVRLTSLAIIAIFLLGLYAYGIWHAIDLLIANNASACKAADCPKLNDGIKMILSLVGGLISALIISVLAITTPQTSPAKALVESVRPAGSASLSADETDTTLKATEIITYVYLIVWFGCGVASVIFGFVLDYPKEVAELTAAAKSWLGLAIASSYAFFGLKTQ